MSSVYKFKLEIDVDTDGDFSYHDATKVTYLSEDFDILTGILKYYFENMLTNIYGKDYVVDRIKNEAINLIEILNTNNNYYDEDKETYIDMDNQYIKIYWSLGNQRICIDLIKVVELSCDGYQKIYNFK